MPKKGTDRLLVNGTIAVRVWRGEEKAELTQIGDTIHLTPGAASSFSEDLPRALSTGRVRRLCYFVDLLDRESRSTGLSDYVATIAGGPPPVVEGLRAERAAKGVLLRWTPPPADEESEQTAVRIRRVVLFDTATDEKQWLATHSSFEHNLFVEDGTQSAHALDNDVQDGYMYEYQAQYVAQLPVSNAVVLELRGPFSAPACIHIKQVVLSDSAAKSVPLSDCP